MADSLAQAWVEVLPDFKNFRNKANSEMSSALGAAGDVGGLSAGRGIQGGILGTVGKIALPLIAAFGAVEIGRFIGNQIGNGINYALDGVELASDLSESANAIKVTFGEAAGGIEDLGKDAATRLGLTQKAFNEYASQFSSFGSTVVGEGGNVVGFIDDLTARGSDFASVYNLEVGEALGLFQSGLAGETEPLRKFGIDLSAAAVEAYAYANGIAAAGAPLTEQEKVQARYGLLLEETAKTAGDFANTSDGLAGQQKILAASFEEAQTKLGTALLPAMTDLVNLANDEIIPALDGVIEEVGPILADALVKSIPAITELIEAFAPLLPDIARLTAEGLPVFIEMLILLAPAIIEITRVTGDVLNNMGALFDFLAGDITLSEFLAQVGDVSSGIGDLGNDIGGFFRDVGTNAANFVSDIRTKFGEFQAFIAGIPATAQAALGNLGSTLFGSGKALLRGFIDGINAMLKPVGDAVSGVLNFAKGFFPRSPAERGPFSGAGWTAVAKSGEAIMDQFSSGLFGPDLSLPLGAVSLPSFARSSGALSAVSSAATATASGFTNNGTIITQDVDEFFAAKAKQDRRALALEGIDGSLVA